MLVGGDGGYCEGIDGRNQGNDSCGGDNVRTAERSSIAVMITRYNKINSLQANE